MCVKFCAFYCMYNICLFYVLCFICTVLVIMYSNYWYCTISEKVYKTTLPGPTSQSTVLKHNSWYVLCNVSMWFRIVNIFCDSVNLWCWIYLTLKSKFSPCCNLHHVNCLKISLGFENHLTLYLSFSSHNFSFQDIRHFPFPYLELGEFHFLKGSMNSVNVFLHPCWSTTVLPTTLTNWIHSFLASFLLEPHFCHSCKWW